MRKMIILKNIHVSFDGIPVLSNLSVEVESGDSVVLTGPSGGGKSTLLKLLLGGVEWQQGVYEFSGRAVNPENIGSVRSRAGYIGQESRLLDCPVRDLLMRPFQFAAYQSRTCHDGELKSLLERLLLPASILDKTVSSLSGGQRQRVNIARTLLLQPAVIIADEPTSALDDSAAQAVVDLLLGGDRTIISSSHDSRWISHCHRNLIMENGRVVESQGVDDVRCG